MKTKINSSDIYFVAALLTTGAKIESVDRTDPRHIKFNVTIPEPVMTFTSENLPMGTSLMGTLNGLELYENQWANGVFMVNAISYKNAIQQVKTLIHST